MKYKKILSLVILFFLIEQYNIVKFCAALPCNLIYMNSDRQEYHLDDSIHINASWILNYDPETQISYIKIQIFNSQNMSIWESPNYDEIGIYKDNWTIEINSLNLSLSNSSCFLYIKFFLFFYDFFYSDYISNYLKTIQIQINKKEISYQLSGFNDYICEADVLNFYIQFFFESVENTTYLVNQTVSFELFKNDIPLYRQILKTNVEGIIHISLNNITNISNGRNKIKILIDNNPLFNTLILEFELYIDIDESNNHSILIFFGIIVLCIIMGIVIAYFLYRTFKKTRKKPLVDLAIEL